MLGTLVTRSDLCGNSLCRHTVELHELISFGTRDSYASEVHLALKWKFKCYGTFATRAGDGPCQCFNFRLDTVR